MLRAVVLVIALALGVSGGTAMTGRPFVDLNTHDSIVT